MKIKHLLSSLILFTFTSVTVLTSSAQVRTSFAPVVSPEIPAAVTLCGERIDLDNVENYERFDRELASLAYTHGTTMLILKRANRYFPQIAPILRAGGVPDDLVYLACVESSLSPRAYSPAKAAGLWQFIAATAKEYGLEVSDEVDERYNIEKATAAAAKFLKKAYNKYGSWSAAMAAYNGGMTRIARALEAQGQESGIELYLAEETMRYPFRIAAMKVLMQNPAAYGFVLTDKQLYQPRECRTVTVDGPVESWPDWAKAHGISYATLRDENPWIRSTSLTNKAGKSYTVRVPKAESLSRRKAGIKTYDDRWTK